MNVDHRYLDRRETAKLLALITMLILVISVCLAVAWFMQDWASN